MEGMDGYNEKGNPIAILMHMMNMGTISVIRSYKIFLTKMAME
jgi:hypothetical protein